MRLIVCGTDTDVGKTIFSAALVQALDGRYWKPIQAGTADGTDCLRVANLSGLPQERMLPEAYCLSTACSPHRAAEIDGVAIDAHRLVAPETDRPLVIECAGGVLVPITRDLLYADLLVCWQSPVVVVARTALGTINHSLLTIEALRSRRVPILGIAFVGDPQPESEAAIAAIGTVKRLGRLPWLPALNTQSLHEAFAANFDLSDFRA
jgi:dethiobiotin synthetase